MAYKQKGCTPITAKLQKTNKGGMVQQPLLNMGAPVKMKVVSPAKQGSKSTTDARKAANAKRQELASKKEALSKSKSEDKKYTSKTITNARGREVKNPNYNPDYKKGPVSNDKKFDYPSFTKGLDDAINPASDTTKNDTTKNDITKNDTTKNDITKNDTTKNDITKNDTTKNDITKNDVTKMTKAGSAERKAQYDAKGWKYDETIAGYNKAGREIQKSVSTITPKKTVSIETKAPKAEIKTIKTAPKAETTTRKEIRSAREAFRAGDITKKQKKAVIGEERAMRKDARTNKKAERIAKNK